MQLAENQDKPMGIEEQEVMNTLAFEEEGYAVATACHQATGRATMKKRDEDSSKVSTACTLAALASQPASLSCCQLASQS